MQQQQHAAAACQKQQQALQQQQQQQGVAVDVEQCAFVDFSGVGISDIIVTAMDFSGATVRSTSSYQGLVPS